MGNTVLDGHVSAQGRSTAITKLYTAAAWIEGRAEQQLNEVAGWSGVRKIAAFPDLHPGKFGPVGCAVLADLIYPQLIGNDIGCGMALFELDLPKRKFKLDKALRRMRVLGEPDETSQSDLLEENGLSPDLFAGSLGTVGSGNHFCEVQSVASAEAKAGLDETRLYLLVHSGSRGLGTSVLNDVSNGSFSGMHPQSDEAQVYVRAHDKAVLWARLNRLVLATRVAKALRTQVRSIVEVPHNLLEEIDGGWLHRKGAAVQKPLVPVAGSRATSSFLVAPINNEDALRSLAHGSGRRYDRSSMHGRVRSKRSDIALMQKNPFGGGILCEDRDLLIEEAPLAYKSSRAVIDDLQACGVASPVAEMHPMLTFKKTRKGGRK